LATRYPPVIAVQSPSSVTLQIEHPVGGKYRLEERLGEGALGAVHRAVHLGLEKSFALKLLKTSGAPEAALARFQREAVALGRIQHPHIVEVTDSGIDELSGAPYLVMELLQGMPLSDICRDQGPLPLAQALSLLEQIADAVDAAHGAGVLHRDLKPGNILVDEADPDQPRVKILDFGLAELLGGPDETRVSLHPGAEESPGLTLTGALRGTPLYAAPELIRYGEASRASDIYSFGVIAYELLGGKPPFQGSIGEVLNAHLKSEPPPLPLPPPVWRVLRQALQKDPALRPRSAGEVVRGLRKAASEAERAHWKAAEVPRRLRMAALLAAFLLVLGLVIPWWPPLPAAERWIGDLRVRTAPAKAPDPRILLVTLDEASLGSSPRSLADRTDEIGRGLSRIFEAGARGVAIDLLLPPQWGASESFSDLLLRRPEALTLAASSPDGNLIGTECMDRLTISALGPQGASRIFGFVNLDEDQDGVVRRGRLWFRDVSGARHSSWAARAARALPSDFAWKHGMPREFWIDTRIDWPRYERISWRQVPAALDRYPGLFRDRLVLVGGDFRGSGDDYYRIPHRSGRNTAVSGLTLQALMVDTIAAGMPIRDPGRMPVLVAAALGTALAAAWVLCAYRVWPIAVWLAIGAGVYLAVSFLLFWWTGLILPVTVPSLFVLLGLLAALVLRRNLPSPPEVSVP